MHSPISCTSFFGGSKHHTSKRSVIQIAMGWGQWVHIWTVLPAACSHSSWHIVRGKECWVRGSLWRFFEYVFGTFEDGTKPKKYWQEMAIQPFSYQLKMMSFIGFSLNALMSITWGFGKFFHAKELCKTKTETTNVVAGTCHRANMA